MPRVSLLSSYSATPPPPPVSWQALSATQREERIRVNKVSKRTTLSLIAGGGGGGVGAEYDDRKKKDLPLFLLPLWCISTRL